MNLTKKFNNKGMRAYLQVILIKKKTKVSLKFTIMKLQKYAKLINQQPFTDVV